MALPLSLLSTLPRLRAGLPEAGLPRSLLQAPRRFLPHGLWEGDGARREIALTIDDGPHPEITTANLDVLARMGVRAGFFLVGGRAERHPDLVRRIVAEGHDAGNHGWSHRPLVRGICSSPTSEIERTEELLSRLAGGTDRLFRPPFGTMQPGIGPCLRGLELVPIYWSVAPGDWDPLSPQLLKRRVLGRLHPGAILVLHGGRPGHRPTADALESLLQAIRDAGYDFVPPSEMARRCGLEPGIR